MMVLVEIVIVVCAVAWQIWVWNRGDDVAPGSDDASLAGSLSAEGCAERGTDEGRD